jgi:hypothetical protein
MTTLTQAHKPHSLWAQIKAAIARSNAARRERAIALWCGDAAPAGHWRADRMYRLMQRAYGPDAKG